MKYITVLSPLLLLIACASPEEIAAAKQRQAQEDSAKCESYGFRPGSQGFGNCRVQLEVAREQAAAYYYSQPVFYPSFGYYYR